jgi:hypothetical protein
MASMNTAAETRRIRLLMLIKQFKSAAALNTALGWARTDPKLAQIRNANPRPGRDKPYQMGDAMAREIEETLKLARGWMDTPPTYSELRGEPDLKVQIHMVMEDMSKDQLHMALRLLDAIKIKKNGTDSD